MARTTARDAAPTWRYPDLTDHVEYLADVVREMIEQEMPKEADHLRQLRQLRQLRHTRDRVKQIIEGPAVDIDRIIRSVRDNAGRVSNELAAEFPALHDVGIAADLVSAVLPTPPDSI